MFSVSDALVLSSAGSVEACGSVSDDGVSDGSVSCDDSEVSGASEACVSD